ncbi:hypothetical protein GV794_02030 [Nocardia cyriacigeorgica]|uniref:Uncharacterized protein n=1 Tax=Nocardia cyriacigeorgica TaxID=135487 RepID=A0ABX0CCZ9_9NOCA|nr:hypothetical protein [Nocardia cyriacigeorgica]NEW42739.1 hypothetical protein [Nocardia cyriacigeorgica]NEW53966.1 hypothetical protein [Nocardia cyriacigeorgica]NEW54445.1 hypothetical protein [Nocardia cyriacigeorgica]
MTENRAQRLLDAYQALRKVLLTAFTLSIELPELRGGGFRAGDSQRAAIHARTILRDIPADPHRRDLVDQLILEWLEALVMTKLHSRHGEAWYGDIADDALTRFQATLEVIRFEDQ